MLVARTNSYSAAHPASHPLRRRGAILLIVLTLIALFAVIGLSFALYAESEALGARMRREAKATSDDPPPVDAMANRFLGQLLYGDGHGGNALLNAMRGYSMATMVYGNDPNGGNNIPYNGIGTVHQDLGPTGLNLGIPGLTDRRQIVNWSLQFDRTTNTSRVFDPEHLPSTAADVRTGTNLVAPAATIPATATYVGRNAPYTYPDRNNIYVAVQDSTTGRILEPSFVRRSLFNATVPLPDSTPAIDRRLAPPVSVDPVLNNGINNASNDDWLNERGRYLTIRPRPIDHQFNSGDGRGLVSDFPYIPMNPDGSFTGDVQNIIQTDGVQRNDAVWINAGLPIVQWRGRNLQPLVAATILPLDGRVNVNLAGNLTGTSTNGFGPWEIGLNKITSDHATIVSSRTGGSPPTPRGTNLANLPFTTSSTQAYASVNWDANTAATPMAFPTVNQSDPTYPAGFDSATLGNTEANLHSGLFNPYSWNAFTNPARLFPHTDVRRASVRYAGRHDDYLPPFFGNNPLPTLSGTGPGNNGSQRRALLTTASNSIARPKLMPNFADYTAAVGPLELNAAGQLVFAPPTLVSPLAIGAVSSDYSTALTLRNSKADLSPVNINRPLADYRAATGATGPLSPTNLMNFQAATNDRQTLARDIFVRLILATGAKAIVNTSTGTIQLPQMVASSPNYDLVAAGDTTPAQYNALRYLAQIAANIVDTIDNDDISTTFVWNPISPSSIYGPDAGYTDMATLFGMMGTMQPTRDAYVRDRVVQGVEKPRVVMNEIYSEVTNAPSDASNMDASADFHVRFWIELINTTNTGGDPTAPLGDGTQVLSYMGGSSVYKFQVYRDGNAVRSALFNPAAPGAVSNITGRIEGVGDQKIDATLPTTVQYQIDPNNGATGPGTTTGFRVVGPDLAGVMGTSATEFLPNTAAPPYATGFIGTTNGSNPPAVGTMSTTLAYQETRRRPSDIANMTINRLTDHAVVMRRLANPYLPANDPQDPSFNTMLPANPYITVDVFTDVTSRDAIRIGERDTLPGTGMRPMGEPTGANTRSSKGRLIPHVAHRLPVAAPGPDTTGFVAPQTTPDMVSAPGGQLISFFNHNNQRTGAPPPPAIEWLVHLDRPVINPVELSLVAAVKPHELTYQFATGTAAMPTYHQHAVQWNSPLVPLYRALESLSVRPWGYGLPSGGRVPGKININMIWDSAVLEALLDPNSSNLFTTADVDNLYFNPMAPGASLFFGNGPHARTKDFTTRIPGATHDETGLPTDDRPFKPFGTAFFAPSGAIPGSILPAGSGLADTILRDGATPGTPAIFATAPPPPATPHPYRSAEMLRKMYNNITTTSDTYLVVMTVGFFEVRNPTLPISTTNPVILGKEVSDQVAGDLRGKYVAIIDRSMIATDPVTGQHVDGLWQTTLAETPYDPNTSGTYYLRMPAQGDPAGGGIQIDYEGRRTTLTAGSSFVVGVGANAETISIAALGGRNPDDSPAPPFDPATGLATVTLTAPLFRLHHGGDLVSNALYQNPGPQPNFDVHQSRYRGVVPYFEKVEIGK